MVKYSGYAGGLASGVYHTTATTETTAPPGNPESVPAMRSESWYWKEWPEVKRILS